MQHNKRRVGGGGRATSLRATPRRIDNGSLQNQPLLALVEWTSGPDAGKFTTNCPVEWIQDFDPSKPWDHNADFAIEWRKGAMPQKGYPVIDGKVHEISRNEDFLSKRLADITAEVEDSELDEETLAESPVVKKMIKDAVEKAILDNALETPKSHHKSSKPVGDGSPCLDGENGATVKMVNLGLGLLVPEHVHERANAARSPTVMTTLLLQSAYSSKYLVGRTFAGQKKTNPVTKEVIQKPGLKKKKKMIALTTAVMKKWPQTTNSLISQAVNNYIGKLRNCPDPETKKDDEMLSDTDEEL